MHRSSQTTSPFLYSFFSYSYSAVSSQQAKPLDFDSIVRHHITQRSMRSHVHPSIQTRCGVTKQSLLFSLAFFQACTEDIEHLRTPTPTRPSMMDAGSKIRSSWSDAGHDVDQSLKSIDHLSNATFLTPDYLRAKSIEVCVPSFDMQWTGLPRLYRIVSNHGTPRRHQHGSQEGRRGDQHQLRRPTPTPRSVHPFTTFKSSCA